MHSIERAPSWFSPKDTVWLDCRRRKDAYRRLTTGGNTHISREVGWSTPSEWNMARPVDHTDLQRVTRAADEQFDVLRTLGLQVPGTEWHVRRTKREGLQLIAHVAIIAGTDVEALMLQGDSTHFKACQRLIQQYRRLPPLPPRLAEVGAVQCRLGHPVEDNQAVEPPEDYYMVDIEPYLT